MKTAAPSRIRISADDAIIAFTALRSSIRDTDVALAAWQSRDVDDGRQRTAAWRDEQVAAYERIAKALGLEPTLDTIS